MFLLDSVEQTFKSLASLRVQWTEVSQACTRCHSQPAICRLLYAYRVRS